MKLQTSEPAIIVNPIPELAKAAVTPLGGSGYRPHLEGLRAVAVYLVVAFHAGIAHVSGGFIGVDVFFVLSGFLVTQLLLKDLDAGRPVRFGRFYARRLRRLLPASAVALLVTAAVYSATAGPGESVGAVGAFQACFLYVANWFFIQESVGYFGAAVEANPVLHFWSLAVEEQFYVIWPLVLAGLFLVFDLSGRALVSRVWVVVVVGVAGLASLGWALFLQDAHPDHAYYGTDTRAYQLLAGALLALTPEVVSWMRRLGGVMPWIGIAGMGGVLVLATSLVDVGPIWRGVGTAAMVVVLLAALEAAPIGPLHALLASGLLVYLGRISYGIYLWHWPVIVVARMVVDPGPTGLLGLSVLIATGIAALSYELVEMPIREASLLDRKKLAVIGAGLTVSVVSALVLVPAILRHDASSTVVSTDVVTAGFTPVPATLDLSAVADAGYGSAPECFGRPPDACTIVKGKGDHIVLMGDSHAVMMVAAFESFARQNDLTLSVAAQNGCPWQLGRQAPLPALRASCDRNRNDAYDRLIPIWKPDVIVTLNAWYGSPVETIEGIRSATTASLARLEAPGRSIVLVEPIVHAPLKPDPLTCLKNATFLEDCRFVVDIVPNDTEFYYRSLADADPDILTADFDSMACPYFPICDPVIGGAVVRWNSLHLAIGYSRTLGNRITNWFRRARLLND